MKVYLTSDEIYKDLLEKIVKLEIMPGERIRENELSVQYGVSRHVLRSAISRLKDKGMVDVYPQRGTFVTLIDMKYVETVLFVRMAVEHEAVERLKSLTDEKMDSMVREMRENIELQRQAIEAGDMEEFYRIDNQFHRCFMKMAGQEGATELIREHLIHVYRWRSFELKSMEHLEGLRREHIRFLDCLEKRDFEGAKKELYDHLNTVERHKYLYRDVSPEYFVSDETK